MDDGDRAEITRLRTELQKDLALGIANFKVWLFAGLLSNALIIGIPALLAFVSVQSDASEALTLARDNALRLNDRSGFIKDTQGRVSTIEQYLRRKDSDFDAADTTGQTYQ